MATLFVEGFDQYGAPNIVSPALVTVGLPQGGWSPIGAATATIVSSLNGNNGYAIQVTGTNVAALGSIGKTLPNNYTRLIGGVRMLTPSLSQVVGITLTDGSTAQLSIGTQLTSGRLAVMLGSLNGTILQTSLTSLAANAEHYIEFDITFGTGVAGGWAVWLDGVLAIQGVGTTIMSPNSYANVIELGVQLGPASAIFDDLYVFDSTTSFNNAALLANPIVLTDVPIAASQTQFANLGNVIGNTSSTNAGTETASANSLWLTPITPEVACNITDVAVQLASANNPTAQFQAVIYADSAGAPGALLASGSVQTGFVTDQLLILPLGTTPALLAGTQYWIGFINNSTVAVQDAASLGTPYRYANNTFTSGPPATAPAMTVGTMPVFMYAMCSGSTANWNSVATLPPVGDASSIGTSTAGTADLYTYPGLPNNVTAVYTVSVSGNCRMDQAGTRKFDLLAKSGVTTGNGANTNIAPTVTYAWYDSAFDTDPNTGAAWTKTAADNATYGIELVT